MNAPIFTCISKAIIASVTIVSLSCMYISGVEDWKTLVVILLGYGFALLVPKYEVTRGVNNAD